MVAEMNMRVLSATPLTKMAKEKTSWKFMYAHAFSRSSRIMYKCKNWSALTMSKWAEQMQKIMAKDAMMAKNWLAA
jgi:hypothetical protein